MYSQNKLSRTELEGALPGSEVNAEEAPDFKEAEKDKNSYMRSWEPEANACLSMRFRAPLIFCLKEIK